MKRSSLVAPLLLISVGVLFLANNLRPEVPVFDLLSRYWPFVLIGWGALRLIEILVWAMQSKPLPASGISGGEWTLIVFICLIGSGMYVAHEYSGSWPRGRMAMRGIEMFGEKFDFSVAGRKETGKSPHILIENLRGNARIVGADVNEVTVEGRKTIQAMQQGDADRANEDSPLEINGTGDRITVRLVQDRGSYGQRTSADLEITVPRGASIEARGRHGDFDISGVSGAVEVVSDNAGVRLQNVLNNVRIDVNHSDIVRAVNIKGTVDLKGNRCRDIELENIEGQVTMNGAYSGELHFRNLAKPLQFNGLQTEVRVERIPGELRMALGHLTGRGFEGPLRLSARTKDVELSQFTGAIDIGVERGDIELRPGKAPLGTMDVRTKAGDIEIVLPASARFELTAITGRGDIQNDYGPPLEATEDNRKHRNEHRGASLKGTVGQGPGLTLTTERGLIKIRKASAQDEKEQDVRRSPRPPVPPIPPEGLHVERQ